MYVCVQVCVPIENRTKQKFNRKDRAEDRPIIFSSLTHTETIK